MHGMQLMTGPMHVRAATQLTLIVNMMHSMVTRRHGLTSGFVCTVRPVRRVLGVCYRTSTVYWLSKTTSRSICHLSQFQLYVLLAHRYCLVTNLVKFWISCAADKITAHRRPYYDTSTTRSFVCILIWTMSKIFKISETQIASLLCSES